jgi:hypothetical protein
MRANEHLRRLVDYLKINLAKGYTVDSLKWALVNQGYSRTEVSKAIEIAHQELAQAAPILREKPTIKYEILDNENQPVEPKKSWWKKLFGIN